LDYATGWTGRNLGLIPSLQMFSSFERPPHDAGFRTNSRPAVTTSLHIV